MTWLNGRVETSFAGVRYAIVILVVCFPLVTLGQTDEKPALRVGVLPDDFRMTGAVDDPAWRGTDAIDNLTMIEPTEGNEPTGRTTVRVLANSGHIVIGIVLQDPDPDGIVSFSKARDSSFRGEDSVKIVLDTFLDGRSGYVFAVNPEGARFDALIASSERDNSNWDTIWEAKTARSATGWSVEIKIPLRSLSFNGSLREWGFNVERQMQRLQETDRWASPRRDFGITQMSRAGLLTELPEFGVGIGLSVRPSLVGETGHPEFEASSETEGDVSLDVTQKIGSNLVSSLTINTDFGEAEVDTRRTNLTRFPLFFPEQRTFFLEGSDIFQFGSGRSVLPFFSRRIGLLDGQEVSIVAGGKLNGRIGNTNIGILGVRTGEVEDLVSPTNMGVIRVTQNVLAESSIGMIATGGDPQNRDGAWTAGVDFAYRTSHFRGNKNFVVGGWAMAANRDGLEGDKSAVGFLIDYPNDDWDNFFSYTRIGESFDPSLGFVPRRAVQIFNAGINYRHRPEISWVRWFFYELRPNLVTDLDGNWESYRVFTAPLNWRFETADRFEFNVVPTGERLVEPFEIADGVIIPPGSYHWMRYRLEVSAAPQRPVSGQFSWWFGSFYGGSLDQFELRVVWKPSAFLALSLSGERNVGDLPQGKFTQELFGARVNVNFSPDLVFRSFLQYDNDSQSVGTNSSLRWTFNPVADLWVVYNHNIRDLGDRWVRDSNQLLVKIQYAFRY